MKTSDTLLFLRPFVLVNKEVEQFFSSLDQTNPNCVLLGDAIENFHYESLNKAFRYTNDDTWRVEGASNLKDIERVMKFKNEKSCFE